MWLLLSKLFQNSAVVLEELIYLHVYDHSQLLIKAGGQSCVPIPQRRHVGFKVKQACFQQDRKCNPPDISHSWSARGYWRAKNDGKGFEEGLKEFPFLRVLLLDLRFVVFFLHIAGNKWHIFQILSYNTQLKIKPRNKFKTPNTLGWCTLPCLMLILTVILLFE